MCFQNISTTQAAMLSFIWVLTFSCESHSMTRVGSAKSTMSLHRGCFQKMSQKAPHSVIHRESASSWSHDKSPGSRPDSDTGHQSDSGQVTFSFLSGMLPYLSQRELGAEKMEVRSQIYTHMMVTYPTKHISRHTNTCTCTHPSWWYHADITNLSQIH